MGHQIVRAIALVDGRLQPEAKAAEAGVLEKCQHVTLVVDARHAVRVAMLRGVHLAIAAILVGVLRPIVPVQAHHHLVYTIGGEDDEKKTMLNWICLIFGKQTIKTYFRVTPREH